MNKAPQKSKWHALSREEKARLALAKVAYKRSKPGYEARMMREWRKAHPLETKAHNAISQGVYRGKIIKPAQCQKCGNPGKVQAHHEDYSKPLKVIWVCKACHLSIHGKQQNQPINR